MFQADLFTMQRFRTSMLGYHVTIKKNLYIYLFLCISVRKSTFFLRSTLKCAIECIRITLFFLLIAREACKSFEVWFTVHGIKLISIKNYECLRSKTIRRSLMGVKKSHQQGSWKLPHFMKIVQHYGQLKTILLYRTRSENNRQSWMTDSDEPGGR